MTPVIECRTIVHRYDHEEVLSGLDLCVEPGQVLAIIGRSGSGKSTFLHLLAGLITPTAGEVLFQGERVDNLADSERARIRLRHYGFVFQSAGLVPEFTAVENVELPLLLLGRPTHEAREAALTALDELEVLDQASKLLSEMSGGQYQRVAVARALVHDPQMVFADEPTGSLDEDTEDRVLEAMFSSARKRDAAVLLVTHDLGVSSRADQVVRLRDGRLC